MDPFRYLWLYYAWCNKEEEQHKMAYDYTVFGGAFSNPEMAKRLVDKEKPYAEMSDEDFDKISVMIDELPDLPPKNKRKKRKIKR